MRAYMINPAGRSLFIKWVAEFFCSLSIDRMWNIDNGRMQGWIVAIFDIHTYPFNGFTQPRQPLVSKSAALDIIAFIWFASQCQARVIIMKNCFTKKLVSQFPLVRRPRIIDFPIKDRALEYPIEVS
jgi:hypothetical protein